MIRRDRNHPSVLLWGVAGNEADFNVSYEDSCQMIAKSEDSTRYTTTARNKVVSTDHFDVYGHNYFEPPLPNANPIASNTGYVNSEHTGHTYQTTRFNPAAHLTEQALRHERMVSSARERPWVAGGTGWCAFDYNSRTGSAMSESTVDGDVIPYHSISYHGVADIFRIPKFAYYFYKSQAAADNYDGSKHPMVFIESYANYAMPSTQTIKVLSNCDQVELFMNGASLGTRSPDGGTSLAHPPFTFSNVSYATPGNLRADGKIGGVVRASQTVNRPGGASRIALWADTNRLANDGSDIARIVVSITDNNGTVVPTATNTVTVSATSLGKVICGSAGPQTSGSITMEAGQLAFLVQAGLTAGTITVAASGTGLTGSQILIYVSEVTAVTQPGRSPVITGRDGMVPSIRYTRNVFVFDNLDPRVRWQFKLIAPNGKVVRSTSVTGSGVAKMQTESVPAGFYAVCIKGNSVVVLKKAILLR
jgi:beta-galactosidase